MTSRDFCFWLQGFFELNEEPAAEISAKQAETIKRHLALVFKHEIDPAMGDAVHQAKLDETHAEPAASPDANPVKQPWQRPQVPDRPVMRC